jgi:pyruvate formate lyase activating enzyme
MDAEMHKKYTGVDNRLILENAEILLNRKQNVIFRIPLIPGVNDSEKDISDFLNYLSIRKDRFRELHLLPYHRIGSEKYKRLEIDHSFSDVKESSDQHIESIKNQFISCGFKLTIGG